MPQVPSARREEPDGRPDERRLLLRHCEGDPDASSRQALQALQKGVSPQSIWDGIFVGAGELLMRQPGIIGLHGLTMPEQYGGSALTAPDGAVVYEEFGRALAPSPPLPRQPCRTPR